MKKEETLDALRRLLVGATIKSIEPATSSEGVAKFKVQRGREKISFDLCGNDLGCWISAEKSAEEGYDLYSSVFQMLEDMQGHAMDLDFDVRGDDIFIPIDVLKAGATGFRCVTTGQEWFVNIDDALESDWGDSFGSMVARKELAADLGNGVIPGQFKINITPEMAKIFNEMVDQFKEEE